jgi:hypothetical protein
MPSNRLLQVNYYKINRRYYTISLPQNSKLNIDYIWLDVNFANIYENISNGDDWQDVDMTNFITEKEEDIIIEIFSYVKNILNCFDLSKVKCIMFTYDNMLYNRVVENSKHEDGINIYVTTHDFVVINNHVFLMPAIESLSNKLNWHYTSPKDILSYYFAQVSSNISVNKRGAIFLYPPDYDFSSISTGDAIVINEITKKIIDFKDIKSIAIVSTSNRVPEVSRIINNELLESIDNITMIFSDQEVFAQHVIYVKKIIFDNYRDRVDNMVSTENDDSIIWQIPILAQQKIMI